MGCNVSPRPAPSKPLARDRAPRPRRPGSGRRARKHWGGIVALLIAWCGGAGSVLAGQGAPPGDSPRPAVGVDSSTHASATPRDSTARAHGAPGDSTHLIKPVAAAWRSLLIPGWGQAATGRDVTGALFVTWEGVTIMMTLRAVQELHYLDRSGSANVGSKDQQIQDWVVLWVFNHLLAGAEAFVAGHLLDFPKDLKLELGPGRAGVRFAIP